MTEGAAPSTLNTEYAPAVQEAAAPVTVAAAATPTAHTPRPGSIPPPPVAVRPDKSVAHGGPTRQFLNQKITPHLLEGMKYLAVYEPEKPLLWLSEFLKDRSKEVEGA
jgi:COMPASS component SDC1